MQAPLEALDKERSQSKLFTFFQAAVNARFSF